MAYDTPRIVAYDTPKKDRAPLFQNGVLAYDFYCNTPLLYIPLIYISFFRVIVEGVKSYAKKTECVRCVGKSYANTPRRYFEPV